VQGPKNVAKALQILVNDIKSRDRPYDTSGPSNFINDMMFIRCLNVTQKHKVNHEKITKKTMAGVAKIVLLVLRFHSTHLFHLTFHFSHLPLIIFPKTPP